MLMISYQVQCQMSEESPQQSSKATVHLKQNLNFSQRVDADVTTCKQRLYLLEQLKRQNHDILALDSVFKAIIVNKCCTL